MALLFLSNHLYHPLSLHSKSKKPSMNPFASRICRVRLRNCTSNSKNGVQAFFFNPTEEPIVKEALKEPVAFMGGMFAGLLRLDLNEDPLKEWVSRNVEASGISKEEIEAEGLNSSPDDEEAPQQIEIE
ncbi:hypothetical protein UlMin_009047 [Ulmus minor]